MHTHMKKIAMAAAASVFFIMTFLSLAAMVPAALLAQTTTAGTTTGTTMSTGTTGGGTTGGTAGTMSTGTTGTGTTGSTATTGTTQALSFNVPNPLGTTSDLNTILGKVLDAIVLLLTPVITIMLLYSGFLFVTAQGQPEELSKAKTTLMYTLIGAAIVLGAKGLELVIQNTVNCLATTTTGC